MEPAAPPFVTRAALLADLAALGVRPGDTVMAHAAVSRVGRLLNGPDILIGALLDAVGPAGTVLAYTDWDARYDELLDAEGRIPEQWRPHIPPFDPAASRSIRENGILPEFLRTTPGARRSGNPAASITALGAKAEWITADHPLDYGYGPASPLAKLVSLDGKVLMIGAPTDTITLLHHAEHLATLPGKRIRRYEVPFATSSGISWRMVEEFDTAQAIVPALDGEDYFTAIVEDFLATGSGERGFVGQAPSLLVPAAPLTRFAVRWLEDRCG